MSQKFIFLSNDNLDLFFNIFTSDKSNYFFGNIINIETFKNQLDFLHVNNKTSFILKDNNKFIGIFLGAVKNKTGYIPSIVVAEEFRRRGYGQVLLQKGLSLFSENKCNNAVLEVLEENTSAINLYKKYGFKITNEIVNFRSEKNSFYENNNLNNFSIKNETSDFKMIYNKFNNKKPWQKGFNTLLKKLKTECELYTFFLKNDLIGYINISNNNNILQIHDIALCESNYESFKILLTTLLLKIKNNIKIVQANNFYIDDPLCGIFIKNGFYIDIKQLEMKKKLL